MGTWQFGSCLLFALWPLGAMRFGLIGSVTGAAIEMGSPPPSLAGQDRSPEPVNGEQASAITVQACSANV